MCVAVLSRVSAVIGIVIAATVAGARPARALDFSFEFSDGNDSVKGVVRGLTEGQTIYPQFVEVTASAIGGLGLYEWNGQATGGFSVVGGQVNKAAWIGIDPQPAPNYLNYLQLNGTSPFTEGFQILCVSEAECRGIISADNPNLDARSVIYTPLRASVPGPLPVLGAAAAFGFSRRLRKRIQGSNAPLASAICPCLGSYAPVARLVG